MGFTISRWQWQRRSRLGFTISQRGQFRQIALWLPCLLQPSGHCNMNPLIEILYQKIDNVNVFQKFQDSAI